MGLKKENTYLGVIGGAGGEQSIERVVGRDDETRQVDEEFTGDVEEDQEEVDANQTEDDIDLGDGALTLEVVEDRVLGELRTHRSVSLLRDEEIPHHRSHNL
jgi:hypothetical protein